CFCSQVRRRNHPTFCPFGYLSDLADGFIRKIHQSDLGPQANLPSPRQSKKKASLPLRKIAKATGLSSFIPPSGSLRCSSLRRLESCGCLKDEGGLVFEETLPVP